MDEILKNLKEINQKLDAIHTTIKDVGTNMAINFSIVEKKLREELDGIKNLIKK